MISHSFAWLNMYYLNFAIEIINEITPAIPQKI